MSFPRPSNSRLKIEFIRLILIRRIHDQLNCARSGFPNFILERLGGENADDK